jgi:hypothetical protein
MHERVPVRVGENMSKLPQIVNLVHWLATREVCKTSILGQRSWHLSVADRK